LGKRAKRLEERWITLLKLRGKKLRRYRKKGEKYDRGGQKRLSHQYVDILLQQILMSMKRMEIRRNEWAERLRHTENELGNGVLKTTCKVR